MGVDTMSSNAMADQSKVPADSNKKIPNGENMKEMIKQKSKKQEVAASTDILLKRPVLFQKILQLFRDNVRKDLQG